MGLRVSNQPVPKRVIGFGFHPNPITDLRAAAAALAAAAAQSDRPAKEIREQKQGMNCQGHNILVLVAGTPISDTDQLI